MILWYIISTILIVLCIAALIRGVYFLCRGILQKDIEHICYAVGGMVYVGLTVLLFFLIDLALGFDLGWIKVFVDEHAVALGFIARGLLLVIGIPLLFGFVCLIKWLFIDTRKQVSNKLKNDDKECEN